MTNHGAIQSDPPFSRERQRSEPRARLDLESDGVGSLQLMEGRYRIHERLCAGTMGVVYRASHVALDAPVVIKVIHPDLLADRDSRAEALARFNVEARVLARLRSPHVVRVLDAGVTRDGRPFMVMEHLEGQDLESLIRSRGRLGSAHAAACVVQACVGLAELHALGMVHRDLKPENLFLAHHPTSAPTVKVVDFGLVRLEPEDDRARVRFTRSRRMLGSPAYLAPEQIDDGLDVDHRADVWALGVVLFELLTGECPFEEATVEESLERVKTTPSAALRRRLARVDRRLARVVLKCLEKDRERRHATVIDLANALRPFLPAISAEALLGHLRDLPKTPGRWRGAVVAASLGFAVGGGCAAWTSSTEEGALARELVARRAALLSGRTLHFARRLGAEVKARYAALDGG